MATFDQSTVSFFLSIFSSFLGPPNGFVVMNDWDSCPISPSTSKKRKVFDFVNIHSDIIYLSCCVLVNKIHSTESMCDALLVTDISKNLLTNFSDYRLCQKISNRLCKSPRRRKNSIIQIIFDCRMSNFNEFITKYR